MEKQTYTITGMSCAGCARSVQSKVDQINGVSTANVDFATKECTVVFDTDITSSSQIESVIQDMGYVVETV